MAGGLRDVRVDRAWWDAHVAAEFGGEFARWLWGWRRPQLMLAHMDLDPSPGSVPPAGARRVDTGFHVGGHPALPVGAGWPWWGGEVPLEYIGQLDAGVIAGSGVIGGFEMSGLVLVFCVEVGGESGYYGDDALESGGPGQAWRLVGVPAGAGRVVTAPPADTYESVRLDLEPVLVDSVPWELKGIEVTGRVAGVPGDRAVADDALLEVSELLEGEAGRRCAEAGLLATGHRVGGWVPYEQNPPEEALASVCAGVPGAGVMRHLWTIATDEKAELGFLDGGSLVWVGVGGALTDVADVRQVAMMVESG